jgi:hypothetical protein
MMAPEEMEERLLYRRSPLQVALLTFMTLGLYVFVWSYFVLRDAEVLLNDEKEQPAWYSFLLLLPIVNFYVIFRLFDKIKVMALRAQLSDVPSALGGLGIVWIAIAVLGRLGLPLTALAMLAFMPLAYAQFFVARAEFVLTDGRATPRAFNWVEILVLVVGGAVRVWFLFAYTFDEYGRMRNDWWAAAGVLVIVVAAMIFMALSWRRTLCRMRALTEVG